MARVYGEPVNVQTRKDGRPTRFVWRGRLYAVRSIQEHWVINRDWWREPVPEPASEAASKAASEAASEAVREPAPEPARPELWFWRVEASAGQGLPPGVYELRQDVAAGTWTLRRVID